MGSGLHTCIKHFKHPPHCSPPFCAFRSLEILDPVSIVIKNILALIAADNDMVKSSRKFYSTWPCHDKASFHIKCIYASLTPFSDPILYEKRGIGRFLTDQNCGC